MTSTRVALLSAFCLLFPSFIQADIQEGAKIVPLQIRDDFWVLYGGMGQGATVGVSVGDDGILLVDAMVEESNERLLQAIRTISDRPIRYVINTHGDFDHAGGNALFAGMGATVISQDNVRYGASFRGLTFSDSLTLPFNGDEIEAHHMVSHSPSDLVIYFRQSNVLFLGDTFTNSWLPTYYTGGMGRQLEAIDLALTFADDETVVVPGHGDVDHRAGLLGYRERCGEWLIRIRELYAKGLPPEEMAKDARLIELATWFGRKRPEPIPPHLLDLLIRRSISTDLVAAYPLSHEKLQRFEGIYEVEEEPDVEMIRRGDMLVLRQLGGFMVDLIPQSETRFYPRAWLAAEVVFDLDASGGVVGFTLTSDDMTLKGRAR